MIYQRAMPLTCSVHEACQHKHAVDAQKMSHGTAKHRCQRVATAPALVATRDSTSACTTTACLNAAPCASFIADAQLHGQRMQPFTQCTQHSCSPGEAKGPLFC